MTSMLQCNISLVEAAWLTYIFPMDTHEAAFTIVEHEWRTSVTVIQAAAEILRDFGASPDLDRDRFLKAIIEESGRLQHVVEKASDFYQCASLDGCPQKKPFPQQ